MRIKSLAVVAAFLSLAACTDGPTAERVLRQSGYKEVEITGYSWLACSKDDTYHTGFEATAPNGDRVTGAVCGGVFFKNSKISLD